MEKVWRVLAPTNATLFENLASQYHPLILRILAHRGLTSAAAVEHFFHTSYERDVHDPFLLPDMGIAIERLQLARERGERIAVFGDYDADGVTATALMTEALRALNFQDVIYYIPDRQTEGYGMNERAVEHLSVRGAKLIVTVDCGITNTPGVAKATALGIDVIISDHHHVPDRVPGALAVINPHRQDSRYPFPDLCGVGVAFKIAQALYARLAPERSEQLKWLLDLVAIGSIADCVPLQGENRTLVKYGLLVVSKTRRVGLRELFAVGRIAIAEGAAPTTQKVAFQIAPRINASGRMEHANASYRLLTETDRVKARDVALEVEKNNQDRQKVTAEVIRGIRTLADNAFKGKSLIFASNEHWRVGILGLLAGKITDEYQKVSLILQDQGEAFVGSLRSIPAVNIIELLDRCADLLVQYGGHAQAAGLKVARTQVETLYARLSGLVDQALVGKDLSPELVIDAELVAEDLNWELLLEIQKMEPFGEGNEEPVFLMRKMVVEESRVVGNGTKHLRLSLRSAADSPQRFEGIAFRLGDRAAEFPRGTAVDVVFTLEADEWNGQQKMQLNLIDLKKL